MIREVRLRDLGVIAEAELSLADGLTVISGETGAGKTMVVTALGLLAGGRADTAVVRSGTQRALVEAVLEVPAPHAVRDRVDEAGGDLDGDELVVVRTVAPNGRGQAHLGGRRVPVSVLGEIGEHVVAIHGQADQWRLRRSDEHRAVLDVFGGPTVAAAIERVALAWEALRAATEEIERLRADARDRALEREVLLERLEEIARVEPLPDEDDRLRIEDDRLAWADDLRAAAASARDALLGDDTGSGHDVAALVGGARGHLGRVREHDPQLAELDDRLAEVATLAQEVGIDLASYADRVDVDPERHAWVQERRAVIAALVRRHGDTIADVLASGERGASRIAEIDAATDLLEGADERLELLRGAYATAADELTALRTAAAARLEAAATAELVTLAMPRARRAIAVGDGPDGPRGRDRVEILFSANPGSDLLPVTKAASGGELSRIMLALEVALAGPAPTQRGSGPTYVFDEVDAGVGGRAALDIGSRLAALARSHQVVVVTHLAQVAAHADRHLVVRKSTDGQVTRSDVVDLDPAERVAELARMMGGDEGETARAHAQQLFDDAQTAVADARAEGTAR